MMRNALKIKTTKQYLRCALLCAAFCIFNFAFLILPAHGQTVTDKMIATVNSGGVRPSLITYSDLLWQLALQPDTPIENPTTDSLTRALNLVISQRLILQEAEKLPAIEPTSKEIDERLKEFIKMFPTQEEFYERLKRVGLYSDSEQLKEIVRQRLTIEKYLDFRFRSFTVVTQKEVEDYYRDVWVPRLRKEQPGRIVPELKDVYNDVQSELTENKIESDTDEFLDSAHDRAEIVILDPAYRQAQ
jgi:hypothetical protein